MGLASPATRKASDLSGAEAGEVARALQPVVDESDVPLLSSRARIVASPRSRSSILRRAAARRVRSHGYNRPPSFGFGWWRDTDAKPISDRIHDYTLIVLRMLVCGIFGS